MGSALKVIAGLVVFMVAVYDCLRQPQPVGVAIALRFLLIALAGGLLIGRGWRERQMRQREREQAQFFHAKVQAAIRESDERGLRVKTAEVRLAALEQENASLRQAPAAIPERIVEVDRPIVVEKIVEVERPVIIERIVIPPAMAPATATVATPPRRPSHRRPHPRPDDDLEQIHGVGPKLARFLIDHGFTQFRQVAHWTDSDIARLETDLPQFKGRIRREGWVQSAAEQHRLKYGRDA